MCGAQRGEGHLAVAEGEGRGGVALLGRLGVEEGIGLHVDAQQGRTTALGGHICAVRDTGPRQHLHNNHDDSNKQQAKQEGVGVSIFAQIANPSMAQDRSDNASVLREARQADRDPSNKQLQARMRATGHHSNNPHTIHPAPPAQTHTYKCTHLLAKGLARGGGLHGQCGSAVDARRQVLRRGLVGRLGHLPQTSTERWGTTTTTKMTAKLAHPTPALPSFPFPNPIL